MAKGNVCLAAGMSRRDRSNPYHEGVDATAWPCNGKERGRRRRSISPAWLKTQRDHGAGLPIDAAGTVRRCSGAPPEVSPAPSRVFPRPADHDGMRRRGPPYVSKVCSRRPPASVLTSLPLPAAAEPQRWTDPPGEGTSSERSTSPLTVHPAAPSFLLALVHDRHAAISPCRLPDYRKLHSEMPVNS
jgi:hypothetical protein